MNDMRRTILWVVFSVSMVLLWDAWQRHNGHTSMFSPMPSKPVAAAGSAPASAATPAAAGVPTAATTAAGVPAPAGTPAAAQAAAAAGAIAATSGTATAGEKVVITTEVMRATLDATGGSLVGGALIGGAAGAIGGAATNPNSVGSKLDASRASVRSNAEKGGAIPQA